MVQVERVEDEDGVLATEIVRGNLLDLAIDNGLGLPAGSRILDCKNKLEIIMEVEVPRVLILFSVGQATCWTEGIAI